MKQYFILAQTFGVPFISETINTFIHADTPIEAIDKFLTKDHGRHIIYAVNVYPNREAKGCEFLAQWLCNDEIEKRRLTKKLQSYSYLGHGPGDFEINGKRHKIKNPFSGKIIENAPSE